MALVWVEIKPGIILSRQSIESINEDYLEIRTISGMTYSFETKKTIYRIPKKDRDQSRINFNPLIMDNKIELTKIINMVNERNSITKSDAYNFGYDCGVNGANQMNCNCAIFSSREKTKEWERGKADADLTKV